MNREELLKLLGSVSCAKELLQLAGSDDQVEQALDALDELKPEHALTLLGAMDAEDEGEIDEDESASVRDAVNVLLLDAPKAELDILGEEPDPFLVDGATESLSNLFRKCATDGMLSWEADGGIRSAQVVRATPSDVHLTVARYLQLWVDDTEEPAPFVGKLVEWSQRAIIRVPSLFRHVVLRDVANDNLLLELLPTADWDRSPAERWLRSSTERVATSV
jgi:hypothetical protein